SHVEALRRLEREAADRLSGLDTRSFDWLTAEARKAADIVGDPRALEDEDGLRRCRNATRPIRRLCATAARMLVEILDKHAAGPSPDYDRPAFAAAMTECERLLELRPLGSALR